MVVSKIVYFHPYLGKIPMFINILGMGWNHQLVYFKGQLGVPIQWQIEWDLTNGPLSKLLELLDTQV